MGALLSILIPLIPSLIQGVQSLFGHGKPAPTPTGPTPDQVNQAKADAVLQQLQALIEKLKAINAPLPDGTLPATIPVTDDTLRATIETIYQQLKAANQLTAAPAPGSFYLLQGSIQALQIGAIK